MSVADDAEEATFSNLRYVRGEEGSGEGSCALLLNNMVEDEVRGVVGAQEKTQRMQASFGRGTSHGSAGTADTNSRLIGI